MRLFTGLELPPEIRLPVERMVAKLREVAAVNWSPPENLHITTKFIGEWPEAHLDQLDKKLSQLCSREPFAVAVKDLGWYPNEETPRMLWAGIHGDDSLNQLASATDERLAKLNIPRESRVYSPHLTLARIKNTGGLRPLRAKVEEVQATVFGSFKARGFFLYSSEAGTNSSLYRKLREYRFES